KEVLAGEFWLAECVEYLVRRGADVGDVDERGAHAITSSAVFTRPARMPFQPFFSASAARLPSMKSSWTSVSFTPSLSGSMVKVTRESGSLAISPQAMCHENC